MDIDLVLRLSFALIFSFLLTFYLIPLCIKIAHRLCILDVPDGKIKTHAKVTPYLGGLAVYLGFIIALSLMLPATNDIVSFVLGATLLLFVGLLDDLIALKYYQKLFAQVLAVLSFLKGGLHLKETFFLQGSWTLPVSFVWMLLVINAFNLVDIMDGLATVLAVGATVSFLIVALFLQQTFVAIVLAALLGALLAFFWYNKPPASIYLGDAGSLFIGGMLSIIPFLFQWGTLNIYGLIIPIIVLSIPLLEVGSLIIIRTLKGIPFYKASPHHFAIYLQKNGWSKKHILYYMNIASLYLAVFSSLFVLNKIGWTLLFGAGVLFISSWVCLLMSPQPSFFRRSFDTFRIFF